MNNKKISGWMVTIITVLTILMSILTAVFDSNMGEYVLMISIFAVFLAIMSFNNFSISLFKKKTT